MRRRANGEGSLHRRKDGRWAGIVTLEDGRRRYVYGATFREARDRLKELQHDLDAGRIVAAGRAITVEQYLREWIDTTLRERVAAGRLKPSTFNSYGDTVRKHIVPVLGREPLAALRPPAIRRWLTLKLGEVGGRKRPLAPRTVQYMHAVLRKSLRDAMNDGYVTRNVAALVEPPLAPPPRIEPLSTEEAKRLIGAAAGSHLRVLWLVLLSLGLRLGEALALRWEDLDLDAGTITISRTVQRLRGEPGPETGRRMTRLVESTPKTAASWATIALPRVLVAVLGEHRVDQFRQRQEATSWADAGLVFTTHLGTFLDQRNVNRAWSDLCESAGVRRVRVHDLRHAAASFMLAGGVDLKIIQTTLRHSRLSTTADIYTHVVASVQRQAADCMDEVLRTIGGTP